MNSETIKKLSDTELSNILNNENANTKDIILASIEKGERDYKRGNFYTTEEVVAKIFEKNILV